MIALGGPASGGQAVALVLVGVGLRSGLGKAMDVRTQGLAFRIFDDAQAHLAAFSPDRADNRRAVIGVGAASFAFVGSTTRRVVRWCC